MNTIDAGAPGSEVSALPRVTRQKEVIVQWSGNDEAGGSGVAGYDVYVRDNAGTWALWQANTTNTASTCAGQDGHTYEFYSVARDYVGHVESTPPMADAGTTFELPDMSVTVAYSPATPVVGQPFTCLVTVTNRGSGEATQVVMTNTIPPAWTLLSYSSTQGTCAFANGQVICELGSIGRNANAVVTLQLEAATAGAASNRVSLSSGQGVTATGGATVSVEPPVIPSLSISVVGQQVLLSWPTDAAGFRLEVSESLLPAAWTSDSSPIEVIEGNQVVRVDLLGEARYYRLAKP